MRIRLRDWRAWLIVTAAGMAVAYVAWPTREVPVPEIPRPGPSAFTEREVQMDVAGAARRVELEPQSAAAWGHLNLLGEYDFSEDKLQDSVGIKPPKLTD